MSIENADFPPSNHKDTKAPVGQVGSLEDEEFDFDKRIDLSRYFSDRKKSVRPVRNPNALIPLPECKDFPGANEIVPPKKYPASEREFWRAVLRRSPSKKELQKAQSVVRDASPRFPSAGFKCSTEEVFWYAAQLAVRHLFLYRKYYPQNAPVQKVRKRSPSTKSFYASSRDEAGLFKKKTPEK